MNLGILIVVPLLLLAGCKGGEERSGKDRAPKGPSGAQQLIEDMTGKTAVERGKQASQTLKQVSKTRNGDLEDVLGKE